MKENVVDVLVFLFDNYLDAEAFICQDDQSLATELEEAGFDLGEITEAFDWLGAIKDVQRQAPWVASEPTAFRLYTDFEMKRLSVEVRGFLLSLEQFGMMDAYMRELILDAVMNLEVDELSLVVFKRLVGLVLLNLPGNEERLTWIEDLVFQPALEALH